jgi:hypothetical protein
VTWCGITWIKSTDSKGANQLYSGETACICPLLWNNKGPATVTYFGQKWAYSANLTLHRGASFSFTGQHTLRLWTPGNAYYDNRLSQSAFFNFGQTLGVLSLGSPWLSYNVDSNINDYFFGQNQAQSYASATFNSVEYRWAKGINWP